MKQLVLFITIALLLPVEGKSQWKEFGLSSPFSFGVHDTSLFVGLKSGSIYRHGRSISSAWVEADTGIDFGVGPVRGFGSIGPYVLLDVGYRSTNLGSTWTLMHPFKFVASCFTTMGGLVFSGGVDGSGVWRSNDSGLDWIAAYSGLTNMNVICLASSNSILFAGTTSGVFRSTDSGGTWQSNSLGKGVNAIAVVDSTVFVGTYGGVYRSTDLGENWTHESNGLLNGNVNSLVRDGKNLFAGTGEIQQGVSIGGNGIYLSTNGGDSWDTVNYGLVDPWGHTMLSISGLCVFDTLLVAGAWTNDHQFSFSFVRPISEMVLQKSNVVQQPALDLDSISIYPNPTTNSITVQLGTSIASRIEVLNVLGASLQAIVSRKSEVTIDLSSLPSGTYFILIETSKGVMVHKVEKE